MNQCPFCGHVNCLLFNPKHTIEGEYTCKYCDSDFSLNGRCKGSYSWQHNVWLTKVVEKKSTSDTNTSSCTPTTNTTSTAGICMQNIILKLNSDWSLF